VTTPGVSLLFIEHPKRGFCLNCKQELALDLVSVQMMRFGIPRTRKHIHWLSAARLEQLGRCRSDECRRLILGTSK
jgi:hypothetical protein